MIPYRVRKWSVGVLTVFGIIAAAAVGTVCADETEDQHNAQGMVDEVCRDVARLRGLDFKRPVPLKMSSREELEKFILGELDKQWTKDQLAADERTFKVLGLLPEEYDLRRELVALYREQVAGLYRPDTDDMILVKIDWLQSMTKILLAHELTHALQDQHFDLDRLIEESTHSYDRDFTILSVVEGGATIIMQEYMMEGHVDRWELLKTGLKGLFTTGSVKLFSAPPMIRHMLLSPYFYGTGFVNHFRRDGWQRINRIYGDFPLSAEQIMHPQKYYPRRDFPQRIDFDLPWQQTLSLLRTKGTDTTLGEIGVLALVESWGQLLTDDGLRQSAERVAAGWDGDRLMSWRGPNRDNFPRIPLLDERPGDGGMIVYWVSTWDTPEDASEMHNALEKWVSKWRESETDKRYFRYVTCGQSEVDGKPGPDVTCVMFRTTAERREFCFDAPYTRTVVRDVGELTNKK
ncbi:MAG: hypothetical protein AMK75_02270 [Planctomycetes bacterium SM23_65]|nr:MAG: hypothetical protein AMK75_02270 [Planctomycetes bacterium SM23_65]